MIELYDLPPSGNCYRVRLMLGLARLEYTRRTVRHHGGQFDAPEIRRLSLLGEVPLLVDGEVVLRDSQAILVYLALKYAPDWMPFDAARAAAVTQWLSFAANEVQNGPRYARAIKRGMVAGDLEKYQGAAERALAALDRCLQGKEWLETGRPTIADVACYPYTCNAGEGGLEMSRFPALNAWLARVERLPGFVPFDPSYPQPAA